MNKTWGDRHQRRERHQLAATDPGFAPTIERAIAGEISIEELRELMVRRADEFRNRRSMANMSIEVHDAAGRLLAKTGARTLRELQDRTGIPFELALAEEAGIAVEVVQAVIAQEESGLD